MKLYVIWLLSGALTASLGWNLRGDHADGDAGAKASPIAGSGAACTFDPDRLSCTPEQAIDLERVCAEVCVPTCDLLEQVDRRLLELKTVLAAAEVEPEEVRRLTAEVNELRARALEASVASVLRMREVLEPAQVGELLEDCCPLPRGVPRTE